MVNPISDVQPLLVLQKALDALALRHEVIANNVANVDTPFFKRSEVSFQEKLKQVLETKEPSLLWRTHANHLPKVETVDLKHFKPEVYTVRETSGRNDQNNVDLEIEMAKLAQNTLHYQAVSDVTARYLSGLRFVISEGRR